MATLIKYPLNLHGNLQGTSTGTLVEASWQPTSCLHHGCRHGTPRENSLRCNPMEAFTNSAATNNKMQNPGRMVPDLRIAMMIP